MLGYSRSSVPRLRLNGLRRGRITVGRRTSRRRRRRRLTACRDRLPHRIRLVVGHRHLAAPLHPALHGAALGAKLIASRRTCHLLILAGARIVVAAIAVARDRLVIVTGPISGHGLVVTLGLIAGHGLVVAALHITGGTDGGAGVAARVRVITSCGRCRGWGGGSAAVVTADLEHIVPARLTRIRRGAPHRNRAAPQDDSPGFHGSVSFSVDPVFGRLSSASAVWLRPTVSLAVARAPWDNYSLFHDNQTSRACKTTDPGMRANSCPGAIKLSRQEKSVGFANWTGERGIDGRLNNGASAKIT